MVYLLLDLVFIVYTLLSKNIVGIICVVIMYNLAFTVLNYNKIKDMINK